MTATPRISKALVLAGAMAAFGAIRAEAEHRLSASPEQTTLARDTCIDVMRIRPGFVPFDACVESLAQTFMEKSSSLMTLRGTATSYELSQPGQTSYSESSPEERRRKEEYSCARLGMLPGSAGFSQCVGQLDAALRSMEHSD